MSYNYYVFSGFSKSFRKAKNDTIDKLILKDSKSKVLSITSLVMLSFLILFGVNNSMAQTTLINPNTDGGFENGSSFSANGWLVSNDLTNQWVVGSASVPYTGNNAAYISNDGGVTNTYTILGAQYSYIYRDITVPAGQTKIVLNFNWKNMGEAFNDIPNIYSCPTTYLPVGGQAFPTPAGSTNLTPTSLSDVSQYQSATYYLPTNLAGTTFRLVISWKNNASGGTQAPASIDNISLTSSFPSTYTSIATGNWTSPSTWDIGEAPSAADNAIIDTGHTVTLDVNNMVIHNLTVKGIVNYGFVGGNFSVSGDLTVDTGGVFNVYNTVLSIPPVSNGNGLSVAGNLENNGLMDISIGTFGNGTLTLNGNTVQTITGSGIFNQYIRTLQFKNTSTAIPNINWQFNNVVVAYSLDITGAKINLGSNKLTYGTSLTGTGTFTAPVGSGFLPGGKFSRYWLAVGTGPSSSSTTPTGTAINSGVDPTSANSRYPFVNLAGFDRSMYITRTDATGAAAGELAVTYNDASTVTTGLSVTDGTYVITNRYNGNWAISNEGTAVNASSYKLALMAPSAIYPFNGNSRIMAANTAISGTWQNGTTTPGVQRISVSQTDLLAAPLYIGVNSADLSVSSIADGAWEDQNIWSTGNVPTCTDVVTIATGTSVSVNTFGNVSKNVTIAKGGTLSFPSATSDLTVGCSLNNNNITNSGTLIVANGSLFVNGYMLHNAGSTFTQSGGDILINGNDGNLANSVPGGTTGFSLFKMTVNAPSNLNLTGGNLRIVNPHIGSGSQDYALNISQNFASAASTNHTISFGDGFSSVSGGTNGFLFFTGSYTMGNVVINNPTGTNRFVKAGTSQTTGIDGDLTITAGEFVVTKDLYAAKNIINNGTLTTLATLYLASWNNVTNGQPTNNQQSISGSGIFRNLSSAPTANLTGLYVKNSNATGVTLNVPLSVSGTLTLNSGIVNTSNVNLLTLGTPALAGLIAGGSETAYIKGPFARTIGNNNANTNYIQFPVGTNAYAPIWLAPSTTAVTNIKAEAFNTNTGTADATIVNLATTRRWEAPIISGSINDLNVRLGGSSLVNGNIPVSATTASGVYTAAFGSVATFVAGSPNTIESVKPVSSANYSGFLSYADAAPCNGVPTPGNTIATSTTICLGDKVAFSLENETVGSGVTYAWESSINGVDYTPIALATNSVYSTIPSVSAYYRCKVTCATGAVFGYSTPVKIAFSNSILTTTPAARCGFGSVNLAATTANSGASIKWYDAASGGNLLGIGSPFTTPDINSNTNFYVASETLYTGSFNILPKGVIGAHNPNQFFSMFLSSVNAVTINSIDIYPSAAGNMTFTLNGPGPDIYTPGPVIATTVVTITAAQLTQGLATVTIPLTGFNVPAGSVGWSINSPQSVYRGTSTGVYTYPYTSNGFSVTGTGFDGNNNPSNKMYSYNWNITSSSLVCSSERVPVLATVTPPAAFSISSNAATICNGQNTPAVTIVTGAADYDTYVWSPATNVTGDAINGWVFNPSTTTTYTLTASQSAGVCSNVATFVVTVNPLPASVQVLPATSTICATGNAESLSFSIINPTPVGGCLNVVGQFPANTITPAVCDGVTINSVTTQAFFGEYTVVQLSANAKYTFGSDGNYVVISDINGTQVLAAGLNNAVYYSNTNDQVRMTVYTNNTCGTANLTHPRTVICSPMEGLVWSPTTGLYNDAAATIPYTGEVAMQVYARPSEQTTYAATSVNSFGCSASGSAVVNVNTTPVPSANNQSFCNQSVTVADLVATGTGTINWYSSETGGAPLASTAVVATGMYYASQTVSGCESGRTMVDVVVNTTAAPVASAQTFCNSATVADLVATGTGTINWYTDQTGGTPLAATVSLSTGMYYASQTISGCESSRTMVDVVVNNTAAPVASAQTFCNSATVADLVATGTGTINWYADETGGSPLAATVSISTGMYYASQTISGCESSRTMVDVVVNTTAAPTGETSQTFVEGQTVADIVVDGTGTINWYATASDASNGVNAIPSTTILVNNSTYYATQTIAGCASANSLAVTVTVTLGVNSFDTNNFKIYPNPVSDRLNLSYSQEITTVQVYDMLGQQIMNTIVNNNSATLDLSKLAQGNYFVKVSTKDSFKTVKVIKK